MRLIDADVIISQCKEYSNLLKYDGTTDREWALVKRMILMINEQPTIEPQRKKGQWTPKFNGMFKGGAYWFKCSECERIVPEVRNGGWNYCPNCGADMREEGADETR